MIDRREVQKYDRNQLMQSAYFGLSPALFLLCAIHVLGVTGMKLEIGTDLLKAICIQTKEFVSSHNLQLALKSRHKYKISSQNAEGACGAVVCTKQSENKCQNVKETFCGSSNSNRGSVEGKYKNRLKSSSNDTKRGGVYAGCKVYKVKPKSNVELESLFEMMKNGVEFWREPTKVGISSEFMLTSEQQEQFLPRSRSDGIQMQETLADVQAQVHKSKITKAVRKGELTWDAFYDVDDIYAFIKNMEVTYPDNAKVITYGKSYEQRELLVIAISKSYSAAASLLVQKPIAFIECNIHAREWISAAFCTLMINELLVEKKECISGHLDTFDIYLIPIANPDGYAYSHTPQNRLWRKTRSPNSGSNCAGADPNRNFDVHWKESDTSSEPCYETFGGSGPASEIEVKNLQNYLLTPEISNRLRIYLPFHSYYSVIFWPWAYAELNISEEHYKFFWDTSEKAVEAIGKRYGTVYGHGPSAQIYNPTSGSADDWTYANILQHKKEKVYVATFELRETNAGFVISADAIIPHSLEAMDGVCVIFEAVGANGGGGAGTTKPPMLNTTPTTTTTTRKPGNPESTTEDTDCDE